MDTPRLPTPSLPRLPWVNPLKSAAWIGLTLGLKLAVGLGLVACHNSPNTDLPTSYAGYVEGQYVYLSVPVAGYLQSLPSPRGTRVQPGQAIFSIAADLDQQGLSEAQARSQAAQQRASNLDERRRAPEVAAAQATVAAAQAALNLANERLARQQALAAQQFVSPLTVDEARGQQQQALAQWRAAQAQLTLAQQPVGRTGERQAAQQDAAAVQASEAQKRWLVEHRTATAPATGTIVDTYYHPGEWVAAGQPVASVLPDQGRVVRFFVPEPVLASLHLGQALSVQCDSCRTDLQATLEYLSPRAEYTPPVIYSQEQRHKLVFPVEARLPAHASGSPETDTPLPPGLPVQVRVASQPLASPETRKASAP